MDMANSFTRLLFCCLLAASNLMEAQTVAPAGRTAQYVRTDSEARTILRRALSVSPIIDGHNDLFIHYFDCDNCPKDLADYRIDTTSKGHTDIPRLRKGLVGGLLLNVFGREKSAESYLQAWDLLYRMEKAHAADLKIVATAAEMRLAMNQGKIAILPSLEGARRLGNNMFLLRAYYKLGLRSVTFAYSTNQLADGSDDTTRYNGISAFGKEMVREMNRQGIIIDMSHISAKAMSDILDVTTAPVIFSHSNVRALCDVNRNVPDEILKRLKLNQGLIMLTPVPYFTRNEHNNWMNTRDSLGNALYQRFIQTPSDSTRLDSIAVGWEQTNPEPEVTIADLADHFDYVRQLIGVEHIGIAGDYDGISFFIKGMENVASFPELLVELVRRDWTEKEIQQITSENFLRVFESIEKRASRLQELSQPSIFEAKE